MRVAIFDSILETHLSESLQRALEFRGHEVFNTGLFGSGFHWPKEWAIVEKHQALAEEVVEFAPDLIIVFRPASAPAPVMKVLKRSGAILAAWLCDDPVLWELSYKEASSDYDILLHCGDTDVIQLYENHTGKKLGVNFPFWTDGVAFPRSADVVEKDSDIVFLGNAQGRLRRRRYHELAGLDADVKIHGLSGNDYAFLNRGYLDSDREVIESCGRSRFALNFPQYFSDHRGLETWFDGIEEFGFFPFPSRVIQYAAIGLPVISIVPDSFKLRTFPEIVCFQSVAGVSDFVAEAIRSGESEALGRKTYERFKSTFSASARVLALESLMQDDTWRSLSIEDRATYFSEFNGATDHEGVVAKWDGFPDPALLIEESTKQFVAPIRIAEAGATAVVDFSSERSTISLSSLLLRDLFHRGLKAENFDAVSSLSAVMNHPREFSQCFVVVDDVRVLKEIELEEFRTSFEGRIVVFVRNGNPAKYSSEEFSFIGSAVDLIIVRTKVALDCLVGLGVEKARIQVRDSFVDALTFEKVSQTAVLKRSPTHGNAGRVNRALVVADGRTFGRLEPLLNDLVYCCESVDNLNIDGLSGVDNLLDSLSGADLVLMAPVRNGSENYIPDFFGIVSLVCPIVFYLRTDRRATRVGAGVNYLSVGDSGELIYKVQRLKQRLSAQPWLSDPSMRLRAASSRSFLPLYCSCSSLSGEDDSPSGQGRGYVPLNTGMGVKVEIDHFPSVSNMLALEGSLGSRSGVAAIRISRPSGKAMGRAVFQIGVRRRQSRQFGTVLAISVPLAEAAGSVIELLDCYASDLQIEIDFRITEKALPLSFVGSDLLN